MQVGELERETSKIRREAQKRAIGQGGGREADEKDEEEGRLGEEDRKVRKEGRASRGGITKSRFEVRLQGGSDDDS